MAIHRSGGEVQGFGSLSHGQANKITTASDLGGFRFLLGQVLEGLVHGEQFICWRAEGDLGLVEFVFDGVGAVFLGVLAARDVDEDSLHRGCSGTEEMFAVIVGLLVITRDLEPCFVHQSRCL